MLKNTTKEQVLVIHQQRKVPSSLRIGGQGGGQRGLWLAVLSEILSFFPDVLQDAVDRAFVFRCLPVVVGGYGVWHSR